MASSADVELTGAVIVAVPPVLKVTVTCGLTQEGGGPLAYSQLKKTFKTVGELSDNFQGLAAHHTHRA